VAIISLAKRDFGFVSISLSFSTTGSNHRRHDANLDADTRTRLSAGLKVCYPRVWTGNENPLPMPRAQHDECHPVQRTGWLRRAVLVWSALAMTVTVGVGYLFGGVAE
jgi:hypothetical protein